MRILLIFLSVFLLVNGAVKPVPPPPPGTADKLEAFPWIKASKAKARFGPTTHAPPTTEASDVGEEQEGLGIKPVLTNDMLQSYLAAITAQLQPFVIQEGGAPPVQPPPPANIPPPLPPKKSWKSKVPKQVNPEDVPQTTDGYWDEEKKEYPDSLYDELYMDWLRKRQVEEIPVATPSPMNYFAPPPDNTILPPQQPPSAPPSPPPSYPPPMMSPYLPYMYPMTGFKLSKAMAQAQVNAALAAYNITTTQKPVKIKLKIPIPPGDDLATVVASGIAGFPAGTTYELSKRK